MFCGLSPRQPEAGASPGRWNSPVKVGLLAGTGRLPEILLEHQGFQHVLNLNDWPKPLGALFPIVEALKAADCQGLVLAGGVDRSRFHDLDAGGAWVAAQAGTKPGDGRLLDALVAFLEGEGFTIVGATDLMPALKTPEGLLAGETRLNPGSGLAQARALGLRDVGQAVVHCDGDHWLEETAAGTNDLLQRAGATAANRRVLYKAAKPQQDLRVDMPSWGIETVEQAAQNAVRTLVFEAERTLVLDLELALAKAEELGVSIMGARP